MLIQSPNLEEIRNLIKKTKKQNPNEEIIVKAGDEEFNRKILEIKGVNILLSPEIHNKSDKLKQKDSGLNEFLAKLAAKNNIKIGLDLNKIQSLNKIEKAKVLARIKQNIMLCKKAKCSFAVFPKNKYPKQDVMGFLISLGASTEMARESILED